MRGTIGLDYKYSFTRVAFIGFSGARTHDHLGLSVSQHLCLTVIFYSLHLFACCLCLYSSMSYYISFSPSIVGHCYAIGSSSYAFSFPSSSISFYCHNILSYSLYVASLVVAYSSSALFLLHT